MDLTRPKGISLSTITTIQRPGATKFIKRQLTNWLAHLLKVQQVFFMLSLPIPDIFFTTAYHVV